MNNKLRAFPIFLACTFAVIAVPNTAFAVSYKDYDKALEGRQKVKLEGISKDDGRELDAYLFKPNGDGPYPALIALHGAGGIFPYQLWWAKEISKKGYVVLFVDHYCTRGHLCEVETDDTDKDRGEVMRNWQIVSLRQRAMDAVAAYIWLSKKPYIKKNQIGLVGWSWGGTSALFAQKVARRMLLPNGGFKATVAFYPNLKHVAEEPQWSGTGPIAQPTLILYGKADPLESEESYQRLLSAGHPGPIRVVGFDGAYRKFDELGSYREKYHPSVGNFPKAFQQEALDTSVKEIRNFLSKNLR
ncbi:MAG: dienelactone hydrolase family protein [Nitrospinota bacterium]|nr:dienelactone hydrolase family protein [Nitrospinota bacterium]